MRGICGVGGRVEPAIPGRDSRSGERGSARHSVGRSAGHRLLPAGGAWGSVAPTGIWHTDRVDAECFRTVVAGGRGRVLHPPGLWFQPERRWLGRNDRYRIAAQSPIFVERKVLSRKGPWRNVWRHWSQRVVQRRSDAGQHGGARVELDWWLGAIEIPARE